MEIVWNGNGNGVEKVISYSGYAEVKIILKSEYFGFIDEPRSLV